MRTLLYVPIRDELRFLVSYASDIQDKVERENVCDILRELVIRLDALIQEPQP